MPARHSAISLPVRRVYDITVFLSFFSNSTIFWLRTASDGSAPKLNTASTIRCAVVGSNRGGNLPDHRSRSDGTAVSSAWPTVWQGTRRDPPSRSSTAFTRLQFRGFGNHADWNRFDLLGARGLQRTVFGRSIRASATRRAWREIRRRRGTPVDQRRSWCRFCLRRFTPVPPTEISLRLHGDFLHLPPPMPAYASDVPTTPPPKAITTAQPRLSDNSTATSGISNSASKPEDFQRSQQFLARPCARP